MGEDQAVGRSRAPQTRQALADDLRQLGMAPGMVVLVHASLRALGWVSGGPVAVAQALLDVLTPAGTLVVPTHSGDYSDPAQWQHPPVPAAWWPIIRASMPAFDPAITPSRGMGRIAEVVRTWPGALRSSHPAVSFAAVGQHAARISAGHTLDASLGEGSPLARIEELDGWVLLLGVGYANCTSFHLAEYRVPGAPAHTDGAPIFVAGQRVWQTYRDVELDSDPFEQLGADYEQSASAAVRRGLVGAADSRLFAQRPAVAFARDWLARAWAQRT